MKESIFDRALQGVFETVSKVSDSIASDFKNTKPFDKKPVSNDEMIVSYSQLTSFEKQAFIDQYGVTAILFFDDMEKKRQRRQKHA